MKCLEDTREETQSRNVVWKGLSGKPECQDFSFRGIPAPHGVAGAGRGEAGLAGAWGATVKVGDVAELWINVRDQQRLWTD